MDLVGAVQDDKTKTPARIPWSALEEEVSMLEHAWLPLLIIVILTIKVKIRIKR